jgi:ketosteroid isomerase-like protein
MTVLATLWIVVTLSGCAPGSGIPVSPAGTGEEGRILALVRQGLEALRKGDASAITDACESDVTYYSVEQDSLLVGRPALEEMYGPPTGQIAYDHFALINPTVRIFGDLAVLAFDFASYGTADESELRTRWRSTHVLHRNEGGWRIVHIHWTLLESRLR